LLCGDFIRGGPWGDYFIDLDLVFPEPVPVDQALPVIASLLPADIVAPDVRDGENPPYAPAPGGCSSMVWRSPTIEAAVSRVNPDWDSSDEVSAVLYSDRQTSDGSSAPFDGTVRDAVIGIGGHNDPQGEVIC
jgi:hypothetical protein